MGQPCFALGLMTLAALTPPQHNVTIIDESAEPADLTIEPDLVGLTATPLPPRAPISSPMPFASVASRW